jgi:RNA polymerase sigma-70 factor (sigma-E family)
VRRNRRAGFEDFVAARRPHLRRLAYTLCGDWHTAEDLVQTALAKLYVAWPRIAKKGAEEAYCRHILVNARIDQSRRASQREVPGLHGYDLASRPVDPSNRPALVDALAELPTMQRRSVVLRHWWGLSVAETAAELGISEGTVKSHTSRALERLSALLNDQEGAPS